MGEVLPPPRFTAKNRVTGKQIDKISGSLILPKIAKRLILKDLKKLARTLLYLSYKNKKNVTPNKNNR
ncbi:hypothetical protein I5S84_01910 [Pseudomonas putida]|uniref:Uncharacterized protein n=1 Tax=Pseudomonas putida TaxID=303 RepID=A0ABD7B8D2_PSEPU|nr:MULTISPECIES: hypothetical protein [Pseudomonas]MBH3447598.1 hypothetical protein [Pseudomonas putida]QOC95767.1 hypothetical protein ID616_16810 [Pseudomonas putida]